MTRVVCKLPFSGRTLNDSLKMADTITLLSPAAVKSQNKKLKRKVNVNEWKDIKRKRLRNAGAAHTTRKGKEIPEKPPPRKVSGKTLYVAKRSLTPEVYMIKF